MFKSDENPLAIGFFGGTFDPVHKGHVTLAQELQQHLMLDTMYLLPCRLPPHRQTPIATDQQRIDMLSLATAHTRVLIDERELKRPGLSYTFDTLQSLRRDYGPDPSLIWCMGMDAFATFPSWHRWQEILSLGHLAVVMREEHNPVLNDTLQNLLKQHQCSKLTDLKKAPAGNIYLTQLSRIPVSSTQVRQQLAQGISPAAILDPAVYHYIQERGLYLTR